MHENMKHGYYECVGEKFNCYKCNFNAMTVLNKIYKHSEFLKRKLDFINGRILRVDAMHQVLTDANVCDKHKDMKN